MRKFLKNILIYLLFLGSLLILKFPILETPYHWDGLAQMGISLWMSKNNLNPYPKILNIEGGLINVGHPPFFYEILAISFILFGTSLMISHLIIIFFGSLTLFFTYLLGKVIFNEYTGFIASILLLFSPLFFAQTGIVQIDLVFLTLSIMTIYFSIKNNTLFYFIFGSLLLITKEPGILIIIIIIIYRFYKLKIEKKSLITCITYVFPIVIFFIWMAGNKFVYGWYLYPQSTSLLQLNEMYLLQLIKRIDQVFISDYKWILSIITISSMYILIKKVKKIQSIIELILLVSVIVVFILFFSMMNGSYLIRYLLPVYPLFFVLSAYSLNNLKIRKSLKVFLVIIIIFLFIKSWNGNRNSTCGCELESNLEYLDMLDTHMKASRFIEEKFNYSVVLTINPMNAELNNPATGYVNNRIKTIHIYDYLSNPEKVDLIYFSPQSDFMEQQKLKEIMKNLDLKLIIKFEKNGKYTEIYNVIN